VQLLLHLVRCTAYHARSMSAQPLASAEFLVVDTETNGLSRERCEVTEIGCVLVGGGELHERWSSLVGVSAPLSAGIQRFTGISQEMADRAPPPEVVLPELARRLHGRVLVAHSAAFDRRVLRQAFERAALSWPDPPVLCTVAMARRLAPLQRRRSLGVLADALGIEVPETHRALPDAETCARVFCALFARLCAHASTVAEARALLRGRSPARRPPKARGRRREPAERPDLSALPQDPGVYVFRDADGRPLYVGKSVRLRDRARAHFAAPADWTAHAAHVEHHVTRSELGALVLENRLIKRWRPPGNTQLKRGPGGADESPAAGLVYLRCRLDIAFPILEVAREPAVGHAVSVGPVRGQRAASELVEQLNSLFGLRHCGRTLPSRSWPSAYGQMGRCLSPCLGDLDPNLYRARLDAALALFVAPDGAGALLSHVDGQIRDAAAGRRYERAAWLSRRRARLEALLARLGGVLRAAHAGARLVLAPHPERRGRFDCFWIAGGRLVGWGPPPPDPWMVARRTMSATPPPSLGGWLAPGEIDEARIVAGWVAAHEPAELELDARADPERLGRFLAAAREGQVDDLGADAAVTHLDAVADPRLPAHQRERDRPQSRRHHARAQPAQLTLAGTEDAA
jgi:DNA polymerase III subunit epsilon